MIPNDVTRLRILTWNVNSVRLRLDHIRRITETHAPDVLCLQELKAAPEKVPVTDLAEMGYPYHGITSIPGYNGVAIFSRYPLIDIAPHVWCDKDDGRHVSAALQLAGSARKIEIHCLYVPAGGDEPDPDINPRFAHKLAFMDALTEWSTERFARDPEALAVLMGDLNVAPLETDVWSHKQLLKVVSHTPIEVDAMTRWQAAGAWVDAMREYVPAEKPLFTWWSYRSRDWRASNRGRRLDHVWLSPALAPHSEAMAVLTDTRDWTKPSDHVPVSVDLDIRRLT